MAKSGAGAPRKGLLPGTGRRARRARPHRRLLALVSCTAAWLATVFGLGPIAVRDLATSPAAAQSSCTASTAGEAQLNESGFTATSPVPSTSSGAQNAITNAVNHTNPNRFTSGADQASGDTFEVNMGSAQSFNEIEMTAPPIMPEAST